MTTTLISGGLELLDCSPSRLDLTAEVVEGLNRAPKILPCKYFYDRRGSRLFDAICQLDEYYLTRTEMRIMQDHILDMTTTIGPNCLLIEFGSGSSLKTRILLDHLTDPVGYVPIDISREHLAQTASVLSRAYPDVEILPVCADYSQALELPSPQRQPSRHVVYFPGSTIGNFHRHDARQFLHRVARLCGPEGGLLIGVDLNKDADMLIAAYDDARGVTAAFNLNLLRRINREGGGHFKLDLFRHLAVWNSTMSRMEMHLVSLRDQRIEVGGRLVELREGEAIRTECSYKYTLESFAALAEDFDVDTVWMDKQQLFSVEYLTVI